MPILSIPRSDSERLTFLQTSLTTYHNYSTSGISLLSMWTIKAVTYFAVPMQSIMFYLSENPIERALEADEKSVALNRVEEYLWVAIRNRVRREELPPEILNYYHIPLTGVLPATRPNWAIIHLSEAVIEGDIRSVEMGNEPVTDPTAAELAEVVKCARLDMTNGLNVNILFDENKTELAEVRAEADQAIREVIDELKFNHRNNAESNRRRVMCRYGVCFKSETQIEAS